MGGTRHRQPGPSPATRRPGEGAGTRPAAAPGLETLRGGLGNRGFGRYARTLSRKEHSVPVLLVGAPPPVHATERATPENRRLAELIDEVDQLGVGDLLKRREAEAAAAVAPGGADQAQHELALEATEYVARRHGARPLAEDYKGTSATRRRLNVRALIEQGVRETKSFDKAVGKLSGSHEIAGDVAFFEAQADAFKREFRGQAWFAAQRMLDGSLAAIDDVLASYGIAPESAHRAASRVARGADAGEQAADVVKAATLKPDVDAAPNVRHRYRLAQWTERLKQHQATVAKALKASNKADNERPISGHGEKWDAADRANADLAAARQELERLWIAAERLHPVLAAYRHGGTIESVDLSDLDTKDVGDQMREVVGELLPKMVNIGKAKAMVLRPGARVSPLSIPSVVAVTRANMFIPLGSLRDGMVNDLVDDAKDGGSWLVKIGAIALALVTLLPTAGASAGIIGIAGASLAAYDAVKAYGEYTKEKTFANTDLDLARSLSTEEPSLTGFAVSLVALGLETIPLVAAFNKARRIKALVNGGEDASRLINELNAFGKPHGAPHLGDEALADIRAEQRAGKAAADAAPAAEAAPRLTRPVGSPHATVDELRAAFRKAMVNVEGKGASNLNQSWLDLKQVIRANPQAMAANRELLSEVDRVYAALRSPQLIEDEMAAIWEAAAHDGLTSEQELLKMATGGAKPPVIDTDFQDYEPFKRYLKEELPFIDNAFAIDNHGAYAHMFQELVVARALGSRAAAARFRHLVAEAVGPTRTLSTGVKQPFWSQLWDAVFDVDAHPTLHQLNSPEVLGPILRTNLGLPKRYVP